VLLLELLAVGLLIISGLFGDSLVLEDRVGVTEPPCACRSQWEPAQRASRLDGY
jgi:uncharacterized membrane protein